MKGNKERKCRNRRATYTAVVGLVIVLVAGGGLLLCSCGAKQAAEPSKSAGSVASDVFKVAMLMDTGIDDGGWSQSGYEGLLLIEKELGAQVAYRDNVPEAEYESVFRQYAEQGYDFIIGHGAQFIPAAQVVAEEFPRIKFGTVGPHAGNNKNLGSMAFREGEMGYLAGVVAALKTQTDQVAFIGGVPYPSLVERSVLFERGVTATNPDVQVSIEWTESWTDVDKAKEMAQAQIDAGADVLFTNTNAPDQELHQIAQSYGIYSIGLTTDQHELAPQAVLTSVIQRMPALLLEGATLVRQGRWEGKQYQFGLQEGVQELAPFYGLLTAEEEASVDEVKNDIVAGKIDLSYQP